MLGPEAFISRCTAILSSGGTPDAIAAAMREALASQSAHPSLWGQTELLHRSPALFIVDLTLPPFATSAIHDHGTWAVIGVSQGCEVDQLFTERDGSLVPGERKEVRPGEVLVLPPDTIHFIANPTGTPARGLHVYGTDLATTPRRMWDPVNATPQPMNFEQFERWEHGLTATSAANGGTVGPAWPWPGGQFAARV